MNRRYPIYLLLGILIASVSFSCNDDDDDNLMTDSLISSTAVSSFALEANDEVLENLDTVFFTIDLGKAEIYNADSLPMGTDVSGLAIDMEYVACSSAEFHVTGGKVMKDTTFVYSSGDSIDFTGDVKFTIVSQDLTAKRTYTIKVNVHQVEPDSLYWSRVARRDLPCYTTSPKSQKTVQYKGKLYCLVNDVNSYVLSTTEHPADNQWEKTRVQFPFVPKNESFTATDDALYILDENNALYKSADGFTWESCGETWYNIVGSYDNRLLGLVNENGVYKHVEYPASEGFVSTEIQKGFPVSGMSQMVTLTSKWAVTDQKVMIGGVTAEGKYIGDMWGYDGKNWSLISHDGLPGIKDVTLIQYRYTYFYAGEWILYDYPALIAVGGVFYDGDLNGFVYLSTDNGINWGDGPESLQMPEYIEPFAGAQAYVYTSTLTDARSAYDGWIEMPAAKMPASYWNSEEAHALYRSRVTVAPTSWECPYIYLFGGTTVDGYLYNNIWRGVINRLTFKPLY